MKHSVFIFLLLFVNSLYPTEINPKAERGVIDFIQFDFAKYGSQQLNGEWEVFPSKLLTPETYSTNQSKPFYYQMPGIWNGKTLGNIPFQNFGYATFVLHVRISNTNQLLGISASEIFTSYKLWIDNKLLLSNGIVSDNPATYQPNMLSMVGFFSPKSTNICIILQIANFQHNHGGIQSPIKMGLSHQISNENKHKENTDMFLFGVLLIMGLYHLGLYSQRLSDKSSLYFGLFCLVEAIRTVTVITSQVLFSHIFSEMQWSLAIRIEYLTMPFGIILFHGFLAALFKTENLKWLKNALVAMNLLYALIIIISPIFFFTSILIFYHGILVLSGFYMMVVLFLAIKRKREGAALILLGFFILFFSTLNDILNANLIINTGYFLSSGVFLFIFLQSFILSVRFSRAFRKEEILAKELETANVLLEEKVVERTSELTQERNELRKRNEQMESELDMARKIQLALIPSLTPNPNIASYYKPMEKVGGDFFDFIIFPDSDKIGIFISDVSGHGIAAAFITSMIKSIILQIAPVIDNPAEFLTHLNMSIINQTDGNFITAFYGIYDINTRCFTYSNAGHNMPYLIENNKISFLGSNNKSVPLAVLSNDEMLMIDKTYKNYEVILHHGSKLLLYTDGLVETVNYNDKDINSMTPDFETKCLTSVIKNIQGLLCENFISKLYNSLCNFRGNEVFDDDVCMICLDVI
ncbi:MAG: SpoIIE family protein phosphatase [Brevinematales bacterium]|nr:SpoIIE family protein phosphatase [Brevinematales bacterium]